MNLGLTFYIVGFLMGVSFSILYNQFQDEEECINLTTHPKVTYEWLTEAFIVDLGDGTWGEVYGRQRFSKAIEIADKIGE